MAKKIFVLGSLNMDLAISAPYLPKAGETLTGSGFLVNPGGKGGNQAVAAAKCGGDVAMIGCVGGDGFGETLVETLSAVGVDCRFLTRLEGVNSGVAVIVIAENNNRIILDAGANGRVEQAMVDRALQAAAAGDIFVTQLELPLSIVQYGLAQAKRRGLYTILNPAPAVKLPAGIFADVDLVVPNETELEILTGCAAATQAELERAVRKLLSFGVKKAIVTLGSKGSLLAEGEVRTSVSAVRVEAVDTTAAGDTYIGVLASKLAAGSTLGEAAVIASHASALAVTKKGAMQSVPNGEELEAFLKLRGGAVSV